MDCVNSNKESGYLVIMNFDPKGLLEPPEKIRIAPDQFARVFVEDFGKSTTRESLYQSYLEYTHQFSQEITDSFAQWIGGSFTTGKRDPQDIDVVTLCSQEVLIKKQEVLASEFSQTTWKAKGLDAYLLGVRSQAAPDFPLYRSDYVYWIHQFSTTRKDRRGRKHSSGYVELIFNDFNYE